MNYTIQDLLKSKSRIWYDDNIGWVNFSDVVKQAKQTFAEHSQIVCVAQTPYQAFFEWVGALSNNIPFYQWMREGECQLEPNIQGFTSIAYTSGTTGYPQRVVRKFETFLEGANSMLKHAITPECDGAIYCPCPWATNNIMSVFWMPALISNRDLVLRKFNPYSWTNDIETLGIGWTLVIPVMQRVLNKVKDFQNIEQFKTLKRIGMGANLIDPGSFDIWRNKNIVPGVVFGSTEIPTAAAFGSEENWFDTCPDDMQWSVDSDNILHLKWNSLGEFWKSNDIVEVNSHGHWKIVGRATTQFKYKDVLVSPEQQEALARIVPGIDNLGLTVVNDKLIMFYEGETNLESKIQAAIAPYVTPVMIPKVQQVPKIPVNTLGKISRAELKNLQVA
jgi:acyl-coenzyme A synthetase/AMP-(fatty) acid ligase